MVLDLYVFVIPLYIHGSLCECFSDEHGYQVFVSCVDLSRALMSALVRGLCT